jgi:hypothetical protein
MKCSWLKFLLCAVALISFNTTAIAGVVVNDTWIDGTDDDPAGPVFSENGLDSDSDGDLESAWFQGGGGTLNPVGAGGPLRGEVISSSSSWTTYFTAEGSEINLANDGDAIKVTWQFSLDGLGGANTSQNFRLAVVDSPAATRIDTNAAPGSGAFTGYSMFMNMAPTLGNSNPFQLRERSAVGDLLGSSGNWSSLANGATTGATGYAAGTPYTYELTMTRNGTSLDIVSTMTGGSLNNSGVATVSVNDPTPGSFAFDTFALRPSNAATTSSTFDTSLFRVEFIPAVPEPASLALIGMSGLALLLRRQR